MLNEEEILYICKPLIKEGVWLLEGVLKLLTSMRMHNSLFPFHSSPIASTAVLCMMRNPGGEVSKYQNDSAKQI
jgi:hypothetical protein